MGDIKYTSAEEIYYKKVFDMWADNEILNESKMKIQTVSAAKVKDIFLQSKVDSKSLRDVWKICTNNKKKYLEEDDFKKAMKWISIIQVNGNLNDITVNLMKEQKLPTFDHSEIEKLRIEIESPQKL